MTGVNHLHLLPRQSHHGFYISLCYKLPLGAYLQMDTIPSLIFVSILLGPKVHYSKKLLTRFFPVHWTTSLGLQISQVNKHSHVVSFYTHSGSLGLSETPSIVFSFSLSHFLSLLQPSPSFAPSLA